MASEGDIGNKTQLAKDRVFEINNNDKTQKYIVKWGQGNSIDIESSEGDIISSDASELNEEEVYDEGKPDALGEPRLPQVI